MLNKYKNLKHLRISGGRLKTKIIITIRNIMSYFLRAKRQNSGSKGIRALQLPFREKKWRFFASEAEKRPCVFKFLS